MLSLFKPLFSNYLPIRKGFAEGTISFIKNPHFLKKKVFNRGLNTISGQYKSKIEPEKESFFSTTKFSKRIL